MNRGFALPAAWVAGRHDEIERLYNEGLSGTQLANHFGTTRSAILGYCHRQGWKKTDNTSAGGRKSTRTPEEKERGRREQYNRYNARKRKLRHAKATMLPAGREAAARIPVPIISEKADMLPDQSESENPVRFLDAGYGQCRYPLWGDRRVPVEEMFICGNQTEGTNESWCPRHRGKVLTAPASRGLGTKVAAYKTGMVSVR
jgi:hypothetical protein